jgi:predicted RNA-binding protein with PIN domain
MAAEYQKSEFIINEMIQLKCEKGMTDRQIRQYLESKYTYKDETSQKYIERMWKFIKENANTNYEEILAGRVEQLNHLIQSEDNSFVKLQMIKELNKIEGLHISKVQVSGQISHINTIRLVNHKTKALEQSNTEPIDVPFQIINQDEVKLKDE